MQQIHPVVAPWASSARRRSRHMIPLLSHHVSVRGLISRGIELPLLLGGYALASGLGLHSSSGRLAMGALFVGVVFACLQAFAMYQRSRQPKMQLFTRLLVVYLVAAIAIQGVSRLLPPVTVLTYRELAEALVACFMLSFGLRLVLPALTRQLLPANRVLVVGSDQLAAEVCAVVRATDASEGIVLHGRYDPRNSHFASAGGAHSRDIGMTDLIEQEEIGEIVVATAEQRGLPLADLLRAKMEGVQVTDYVTFLEREKNYLAIDAMRPSWLLFSEGFAHGPARVVAKRLFDIVVSLMLLIVLGPLLLLGMLGVFLETGRPIFFRQERIGLGGRPFNVLKLRSMVTDAEAGGPQWAKKNDARVTRVGRFLRLTRIDEIPQLLSVLKGDMSFVGPRPEREYFIRQLREQIPYYDLRHTIKPGLSGWAQVSYPYGASAEDARAKLRYDLYYIKNHSLLLDVLILLATVRIVVFGSGAR